MSELPNSDIQIIENTRTATAKKIWQNLNKLTGKQPKQETKGLESNIDDQLVRNSVALAQEFNCFFNKINRGFGETVYISIQ